ncbi:hypothetical protein SAMN06265365_1356 [Tistlia consotensis]|uniref:Winged helix-turn-helix domain-containing protein n=1 Tax=Tistlia consotensis USBA 355 TaxID=560819 RepID=A0A1Y6CPR7_9PROT|nr:crosslink repair DNA glycosylase YcaQ family protein [Tistlia consotensis]SMF79842.1 hypothetical protein SAMN05428998_14045 [Tistlia consotensis USBA 355]SNS16390.1 hypothetical protein SAMN06265365_1356 [Tistlia consotensis]
MPSDALPLIANRQARRLLLQAQGLAEPPNRRLDLAGLQALIEQLGFVQVDSINVVERAHHQILFSRNQTYRQKQLTRLLERERSLFENWTHDAAILPSRFWPWWQPRFERARERLAERWRSWHGADFEGYVEHVAARIADEGPLMARDFGSDQPKGSQGWWNWHPEKVALEYLWRTGVLAVTKRVGFQKVYDLSERVIPEAHRGAAPDAEAFRDWKCRSALERLVFATPGEIARFWDALTPAEATDWCRARLAAGELVEVAVENADGSTRPAFAFAGLPERLAAEPEVCQPPARLRALSPFDPLIRDRQRLERIFGFDYRIEVFVPAPKRQYGYYVFPLLEGERFVGRADLKADRQAGTLRVQGLWWEPKVRSARGREQALEAELERLRRFAGVERLAPPG